MRSPEAPSSTRRRPERAPATEYTVRLGGEPWPEELVGGKANGLVTLTRAGIPVPDGFIVTAAAFEQVVERVVTDVDDLSELRDELRDAELPVALTNEIRRQLVDLGPGPWAVRSSGLAEDDSEHSFAGQHVTELGAGTLSEVTEAIRKVWAGALADSALQYRVRLAVDAVPAGIAVVVQTMVMPDVAGVMFTVNPVTGNPNEAVVSSAKGLGTAVVGGEACDTYYVERPSGYTTSSELVDDTLDTAALRELVRYADRAERALGGPVDLEWARVNGEFVFLQARPITGQGEADESVWTNSNVGEALPGVATPLTWSIIRRFSRRGFERAFGTMGLEVPEEYELVGSFAGRVYLNLTQFAEITSHIPVLSPDTLFEMAGGGGVELVRDVYDDRDPLGFVLRLPATIPRILGFQFAMPVVAPIWDAMFRTYCEGFFQKNLERLNHGALSAELDKLDSMFDWNGEVMLACASNFLLSYAAAREFLRTLGRASVHGREQELLGGLHVPSADPGLRLLELGRIARRSRRLRRIIEGNAPAETLQVLRDAVEHDDVSLFLDEFEAFRREFGHRAPREAELATPRWREDTRFLFEVLRGFLAAPHLPTKLEVERDRQKAFGEVERIVEKAFTLGLGRIFRVVLGLVRGNARRREMLRNRVVDSLDMYRRYFLEVGRRLSARGDLARPEDVFFLTIDEVRMWLGDVASGKPFRYRVLVRRALQEEFAEQPELPNIFVQKGTEIISEERYLQTPVRAPSNADYLEIDGLPASPGRVSGPARVITDPSDASRLAPGEVLVVPYADVGWTPMFLTASAVVMELGGPLSHAAIVAREYGVPAVVNARGILESVETGDIVTVDGERGVVFVRNGE